MYGEAMRAVAAGSKSSTAVTSDVGRTKPVARAAAIAAPAGIRSNHGRS